MNYLYLKSILFIALFTFLFSCNKECDLIYFNSFESEDDISKIINKEFVRLKDDCPPEGGQYSLEVVTSGCFSPSPTLVINSSCKSDFKTISFYWKGSGIISFNSSTKNNSFYFSDSDWQYHEIPNLYFSKKDNIEITIIYPSAGFGTGLMLIDLLTIKESDI